MAKKITTVVKLQLPAGKATPGPPVGSSLGPTGINLPAFVKEYNAKTEKDVGMIFPVIITVFSDRTYSFIIKTPPTAVLIKKATGAKSGSAKPNRDKVASMTEAQVEEIAKIKMVDMTAATLDTAKSMVRGTARSMGVTVVAK